MKLSEAIRLGAMMKPQGFGLGSGNRKAERTCALGAAYEAGNVTGSWPSLVQAFPIVKEAEEQACPACGETQDGLIAHINDHHRWTREEIADWVEAIEREHDANQQASLGAAMEPAVAPAASEAQKAFACVASK
jgi:hypothetical protein